MTIEIDIIQLIALCVGCLALGFNTAALIFVKSMK